MILKMGAYMAKNGRYFKLIICIVAVLSNVSCAVGYVVKQGYFQAKLLCGARPIESVLSEDEITLAQKEKLQEILDLRHFVQKEMALTPGSNYSKVNMTWSEKIYNVSASKALAFEPYTWWFPIIGTVPYKGFFDKDDALAEVRMLKDLNYDVFLGMVGGYSTLGYFSDPVWPQMLEKREGALAELIIHELAHATVYFNNQSDFNESFANFVGRKGALQYLAEKYGPNSEQYLSTKNIQEDEDKYSKFMWQLYQKLAGVYESNGSDDKKLLEKQRIIAEAPAEYKKVDFASAEYKQYFPRELNNAILMSFKRYNSDQSVFLQLYERSNNSWSQFIKEMKSLEKSPNALEALRERNQELSSGKATL